MLSFCSKDFQIISEVPARGGQVRSKISEFNKLSLAHPVILLMDLDTSSCAPELLDKLIKEIKEAKNKRFLLNIAVDEAEAWLMADKKGFADYFSIPLDKMPEFDKTKQGGMKECTDLTNGSSSFQQKSFYVPPAVDIGLNQYYNLQDTGENQNVQKEYCIK